jgi:hypothetical protein
LACRAFACSIVASASSASSGETSSEQKPSTPSVRSWTEAKSLVASCRSATASSKKIRSSVFSPTPSPASAAALTSPICSS